METKHTCQVPLNRVPASMQPVLGNKKRKRMKKYIPTCSAFLLFFFLASCKGPDQTGQPKGPISQIEGASPDSSSTITDFKVITTPNAPTRITRKIKQDKEGNLLIAAFEDIIRYDGKSFRNFTTKEGLTHNDVNTIMEDKTGKIWIGTRGTVCVYDPSAPQRPNGKSFTEITNEEGKPFVNVWSIIEDRKGNIWLGAGAGIWRYDGSSFTLVIPDGGGSIYADKEGNIWTGAETPDRRSWVLTRYDKKSLLNEKVTGIQVFKADGPILGISEDKEGNIWLGSGDGLWCYDGKSFTYFTGKQAKD